MVSESSDIENFDDLIEHLASVSRRDAHMIATRCVLRAMLLVFNDINYDLERRETFLIGTFRCALVSYAYHFLGTPNISRIATQASDFMIERVSFPNNIHSVASAIFCAEAIDEKQSTVLSLDSVSDAFRDSPEAPALWRAVSSDVRKLKESQYIQVLTDPLWQKVDTPALFKLFDNFNFYLHQLPIQWRVIGHWLQHLQIGRDSVLDNQRGFEFYESIIKLETNFWERNPDHVVLDISNMWGRAADFDELELFKKVTSKSGRGVDDVDFFISYSIKNEIEAREICGYLDDAGLTTIAQFKDFPVGSNFVIEMQEGLERGARAIALLSPDYVASDHCRAEWAAVYNMDPIGKDRRLVSFLLEPTELNKLQRQVVYSSLIGLKQDERRRAVLDAIRHYPETLTQDSLKNKLADIASPDVAVTVDGKIDVIPNSKYDNAVNAPDLLDLPFSLRTLCSIIEISLPENSPKSIAPTFAHYRGHLEERGARPIVGLLGMLVTALTKEFESADFEFWGAGLSEHFESFFACHSKLLGHFPRSAEREQTFAEAEINEDEASGDSLVLPVQSVANTVEELGLIDAVTPNLERIVQGQVQIAKDISNLPPNLSEDAGKGNVITPKRRFVLSQLGFWERLLAAVGSGTTLATTPQGQAAIVALKEAIAKFLSFVPWGA